jgi:hypothetical protein
MNNLFTVIIIGIYTLIYLIVFFVQKAQVAKMKEINILMKSYMEIFKIDEIKKYVELKTELANMKAINFITNSVEVEKTVLDTFEKNASKWREEYLKDINDQHKELAIFAYIVSKSIPEGERNPMLERLLPLTGKYIIKALDNSEKC